MHCTHRVLALTALLFSSSAAAAVDRAGASELPPGSIQSCFSSFSGSQDTTRMQPKDFALINAGATWHLFYTRQYATPNYTDRTNTRAIGHAVSTDPHLSTWTVVDRSAIRVRDGRHWDNLHVWAPSIVRKDGIYYMFYAGVELDTVAISPQLVTTEIQRIGLATSLDLNTWKQDDDPVFFAKKVAWTYQDSTAIGNGGVGWQFRDPYVMPDPEHSGEWLMYYVTIDSTLSKFVVGVATTVGQDLRVWKDLHPLRRTSAQFMNADRDESPQVFWRQGKWWLLYMSNHFMANDQITYSLNATSPADSAGWSKPDTLKAITCGEHDYPGFLNLLHALEHVGIGENEYLAGFSTTPLGVGIIQFTQLQPPDATCPNDSLRMDCPTFVTAVDPRPAEASAPIALTRAGGSAARSSVSFDLALRSPARVHVAVYDVFGRRVKTLVDAPLPAGTTALAWDGRTERGARAGSGIYFARATARNGRSVVRFPWLR